MGGLSLIWMVQFFNLNSDDSARFPMSTGVVSSWRVFYLNYDGSAWFPMGTGVVGGVFFLGGEVNENWRSLSKPVKATKSGPGFYCAPISMYCSIAFRKRRETRNLNFHYP